MVYGLIFFNEASSLVFDLKNLTNPIQTLSDYLKIKLTILSPNARFVNN